MRQLLECEASTEDRNSDGLTPLAIATKTGNVALVKELQEFGASN